MGTSSTSLGRNFLSYNKKFHVIRNLEFSINNVSHLILSGQLNNVV